ncbi:MAG TPA: glycoside hydrolase family 130 protein [Acidimicrobiia bacterium]|nr:glycoside hydrolase family 130 protein [Acidimicrobiia bacterium]
MVAVTRSEQALLPDASRVLALPFRPGENNFGGDPTRVDSIAGRIELLTDEEVVDQIEQTEKRFTGRHRDIEKVWARHTGAISDMSALVEGFTPERRRLTGMVFTQEYAFESTALCNPSIVPMGDSTDDEDLEFVMSTRSIGEGHLSSISFRSGRVTAQGDVVIDPVSRWAENGTRRSARFEATIFGDRLKEMRADNSLSKRVLGELPSTFTIQELETVLDRLTHSDEPPALRFETQRAMHWLASSSYEVEFDDVPLTERILSPSAPTESRGMEDARMVRFVDDDGSVRYYATYTAYDGFDVLPQLIETGDFRSFRVATLTGACARGKGLAIFPRRIGGDFVALARTDHESTFVVRSDHVRRWDMAELALRPSEPWELVQAGNCGSPIETAAGWLVLMHGVGPMRRYVISAVLLDLDEPTKVVGRLRQPLIEPDDSERDGYVPNVVYSCGGLVHGDRLVIPYGFSDMGVRVATASLEEVLAEMA